MEKKRILFCGNGLSCEIIKNLKDDYLVYMISEFEYDHGIEYVDKLIYANSKSPEDALKAAIRLTEEGYTFDAVLSLCWDSAMSVSKIGEYFKLNCVPYEVSKYSSIKSLRSQAFEKNNIPAPKYRVCNGYNDFLSKVSEIELPIVLKPLDLSSSKGVILVENNEELKDAYLYTTSFSNSNEIIINEFVKGTEYSAEGLMVDGKYYMSGLSERVFHYEKCKPLFVEIGDIMPTLLNENEIENCRSVTEKAAIALGINNGIVKADLIINEKNEVKVFEITPRLGGPRFGTEMIPLSNGTNILRAAIQQALGESISLEYLKPKYNKGMVNRSIFPRPGIITNIEGLHRIHELPGYYDFKWWGVKPLTVGDMIQNPENMCGGVAYIIAHGEDRNEALKNADMIENSIIIQTR